MAKRKKLTPKALADSEKFVKKKRKKGRKRTSGTWDEYTNPPPKSPGRPKMTVEEKLFKDLDKAIVKRTLQDFLRRKNAELEAIGKDESEEMWRRYLVTVIISGARKGDIDKLVRIFEIIWGREPLQLDVKAETEISTGPMVYVPITGIEGPDVIHSTFRSVVRRLYKTTEDQLAKLSRTEMLSLLIESRNALCGPA